MVGVQECLSYKRMVSPHPQSKSASCVRVSGVWPEAPLVLVIVVVVVVSPALPGQETLG